VPGSVGEARELVRDLLEDEGRDDLVETATLLVSEIVTNAILHAGTPIEVRAVVDESGVRVEVGDGSEHLPT
jgi:anti-sigma regulatory factor (Ser/Thr protein kinase)